MGLLKITKKEFIEMLTCNKTILTGSVFRWDDEKIISRLEDINSISKDTSKYRVVTENHANYVLFNTGSRLTFDQNGKKEYFQYKNSSGIEFIMQRTEYYDTFDEKTCLDYIVYTIVTNSALHQ